MNVTTHIYMCVCMLYGCIHLGIYIGTHTWVCMCMHILVYVFVHICMDVGRDKCMNVHTCTHYKHACMHTYMHMYVCMYICVTQGCLVPETA